MRRGKSFAVPASPSTPWLWCPAPCPKQPIAACAGVYNDKIITELSKKIALILDIKGCVNFEFIFNKYDNNYYFIECNPRFSGGVEFSCLTGYDMVKNHLNVFLNKQIDKSIEYPNMFIARKYEEYITCKE